MVYNTLISFYFLVTFCTESKEVNIPEAVSQDPTVQAADISGMYGGCMLGL